MDTSRVGDKLGGRFADPASTIWPFELRSTLLGVLLIVSSLAGAQTAPTNFNLATEAAQATDIDGVPGYGANFATGNTYNLRFGQINATTGAQTPIIESFEVGADLFIQVPRAVPTPYDRVIVNRRATDTVTNMNKFTGFFSNNGLSGNIANNSVVFFQSEFVNSIEEIINSYDIDRGADNVFANAASVATRNNIQRIDMMIDDPLVVGTGALPRTGILILERGGNDQLTVAAITGIDPVTGEVTSLGPLIKTTGPLGNIWGPTGVARATTVFQNANAATGFQDIRPDQNINSQSISGSFVSLADLGVASGQPMYGLALFGNDVVATMDLIGLSDVPLNTDGTANGGLDLMGGGGFFFSSDLELVKQADVSEFAAVGDEIQYSFTLANNGALPLTNVQVDDPMLGGVIPCTPANLLPGETADCGPVTYIVTQADIDAGQIINLAQGSGLDPDGEPLFALDTVTLEGPVRVPGIELEKLLLDVPAPAFAGDLLEFSVTATNTGNVTLSDVVVSDPLLTPDTETCPILAPLETCVLLGSYELTQADIDSGEFINLASVEAPNPIDPAGPPLEDEDEITTPLPAAPDLVLDKLITAGNPYANVGDVISYELTATNTGNVTLFDVEISDPDVSGLNCTPIQPATLAPTETLICTGTYTVVQGDIDAGSFTNTAAVTGEGPNGEPASDEDDATADGPPRLPSLITAKALTDAPDPIVVGSVLTYTVTATNTGNVTLFDVVVVDSLITPDTELCPAVLPLADCVLVGTYTVTQADLDAGQILNIGSAEAPDPTDPDGPPLVDDEEVITPLPQDPGLVLDKLITGGDPYANVGDVISYQLTATNTGNVTLSNVEIDDPSIATLDCTPDQPATLAPTETLVCTGSYTVVQANIDAGSFTNTATVTGEDPNGVPLGDEDNAIATGPAAAPALTVTKALTDAPEPIVEGSVLTYTVTATNTGNVTLNNVIVSDSLITPDSISCPTMAPTGTCVLTGTYTVTQGDINAGQIVNTGTADSDETGPENDTVTTPLDQNPALAIEKELTDAPTPIVEGSVLTYTITATNTGDITLNNVVVSDTLITPDSISCPTVAPTGTCVLTGTYTVTQGDINAGQIVNTGTADSDETGPEDDTVTTPLDQNPGLAVEKELTDAPDPIVVGSVLEYTITATNTGNVTLTDVVVSDPLIDPASITCAVLAIGETCILVGTYTVEQDDVDAGQILNAATAQAPDPIDPDGPPLVDEDEVITPLPQMPALVLEKLITAGDPYANVGDVISYQLTATNTGNVTLSNVEIVDPDITTLDCSPDQPAILAPTQTLVCTGSYTVVQGNIDVGSFTNTATVTGESPAGEPVGDEDNAEASGPASGPAIEIVKVLSDAPDPMVAGSVLEYTITATNSGNVTLAEIVVMDDMIMPDTETCLMVVPGDTCVLVGTYVLTQADLEAGEVLNVAIAIGTDGDGVELPEVSDNLTVPVGQPVPGLIHPVPVLGLPALLLMLLMMLGLGAVRLRARVG